MVKETSFFGILEKDGSKAADCAGVLTIEDGFANGRTIWRATLGTLLPSLPDGDYQLILNGEVRDVTLIGQTLVPNPNV